MKTLTTLAAIVSSATLGLAAAPAAPPVSTAPLPPPVHGIYVYEQKPITALPQLVSPQQAQAIIDRFRASYGKLGNPRILVFVNRDLVDEKSGLRLTSRNERSEITRTKIDSTVPAPANPNAPNNGVNINAGGNVNVSGGTQPFLSGPGKVTTATERKTLDNTIGNAARPEASLTDRQTVRDVERLFGRPLRMGGASLTDQRVATQLIADKPIGGVAATTEGEAARKDREALAKVADVVLEILISARRITVTEISGDRIYTVPDIQATAIRLSDSKIMGQVSAADIIGKDKFAGRIVSNFDVREITEATALALMEDMLLGVQP